MQITSIVSDLSSVRGWLLREKTWKCYMALLSISGIRSKSQLKTDTLKSAGVDPVGAKATHNGGDPTFYYPCYPPWDKEKTFRKMNTDTTYGRPHSDWRTDIGMERGGELKIWWDNAPDEDAA